MKTVLMILLLAVSCTAQTAKKKPIKPKARPPVPVTQPDPLSQSLKQMSDQIEGLKREAAAAADAAKKSAAREADQAAKEQAALRAQLKSRQESSARAIAERERVIADKDKLLTERGRELGDCQILLTQANDELVEIRKNIKRRALWRILTFRW